MRLKPENTINRAAFLIREGYVQGYEGDGVITCWSQTFGKEKIYAVTADSCTCWIGENKPTAICKHRLACFAPEIVALSYDMYHAESEEDLIAIAQAHAESVKDSPEEYLKFARKIFSVQRERLRLEKEKMENMAA